MRYVLLTVLLLSAAVALAADVKVPVFVDGQMITLNPSALMRAGRTYVPLRGGAAAIGGKVTWDGAKREAMVCVGDRCAVIKAAQGINVDGHLLIPLRLMGEALGCGVQWNAQSRAVMITRPRNSAFH
jgi:Copper amine oxidase N-terminal domain